MKTCARCRKDFPKKDMGSKMCGGCWKKAVIEAQTGKHWSKS